MRLPIFSRFIALICVLACANTTYGQSVGISGSAITPNPESILELKTTTQGVLLPRLTSAERTTLTSTPLVIAHKGLTIFNTTTDMYNYWDGTQWVVMQTAAATTGVHIENQNTLDQPADFRISGDGTVKSALGIGAQASLATSRVLIHDASGTAGELQLLIRDNASSPILAVEDIGRVGIGTLAPTNKLHIENNAVDNSLQDLVKLQVHTSVPGNGGGIQFSNRWNSGSTYWTMARIAAIEQNGFGGQLVFSTNLGTGSGDDITVEAMRIDENGYVGIGTPTPLTGLHINKPEGAGSGYLGVGIGGGPSGNAKIELRGGTTPYIDFSNDAGIDYDGRFRLLSDDQLIVEGASFGIGIAPLEALHVSGNVRISGLSAGGNVQADGSGNLIISTNLPANDADYIWNQNAVNQGANFRINGWGETYGLKINAPDGEKIQLTSAGAAGSKIRHTSGWAIDYHAGPGNTTTTGSHRFYTTAQNIYRERLGIESTGRVNIRQDIGNDPAFAGLTSPESAGGRAQLVLSSSYSDLVIASSQGNNNHGSTLTFATYDPSNPGDYRKFVVNQGNWGSRAGFLDFGFANTGGRINPHDNINASDNVVTMDGYNKRVGIYQMNPQARLHVRAAGNDNPANNGVYVYNEDTGGDNDDAIVTTRVNGASAGDPFFSMDVNGITGWSIGLDNSDGDKLKFANAWSNVGTNTRMTLQTDGKLGIGTTAPTNDLDVNGQVRLRGGAPGNEKVLVSDANGVGSWSNAILTKPKVQTFTIGGSTGVFYPVVFDDPAWNDGPLELELARSSTHTDVSWAGSMQARFYAHSTSWGHGSEFINAEIRTTTTFIAGYQNHYYSPKVIIWLRGGRSYNYRSNTGVVTVDFAATAKTINGVNYATKTTIDAYVNSNGTRMDDDFHVNGRIKSNGINETSDIRFKKDIVQLSNALDMVQELEGVYYHWRTDEFEHEKFESGRQIGVIAQNVEEVAPELVETNEGGYKSVEYSHMVPILIEAIKEQQKLIEQQSHVLSDQKVQISNLNNRLEVNNKTINELLSEMKGYSISE